MAKKIENNKLLFKNSITHTNSILFVPLKLILSLSILEIWWWVSSLWISMQWSSKQKDEWFRLVDFVMDPASALSDTNAPPFHFV